MTTIVGVRFRGSGKVYYFDPAGHDLKGGMHVIVETARGVEYGTCSGANRTVSDEAITQPLKPILRIATEEDERRAAANIEKEKEAIAICKEKIRKHELEMKLIDVEYTFDNNKVLFYFTADGRIDFRELVKDLAAVFRTRIELRQIGVRDETKILGGIGICGRELCCRTWLTDFVPVSIRMAKEQNLSLNPTKISGVCGRLMCCLKNEEDTYEYLNSQLPAVGESVTTVTGLKGEVAGVSVLRQKVKVLVEVNDEKEMQEFDVSELHFKPRRRKEKKEEKRDERKENRRDERTAGYSDDRLRAPENAGADPSEMTPSGNKEERLQARRAGQTQDQEKQRTQQAQERAARRAERAAQRSEDQRSQAAQMEQASDAAAEDQGRSRAAAGNETVRREISQEEREQLSDLSALLFADEAENASEAARMAAEAEAAQAAAADLSADGQKAASGQAGVNKKESAEDAPPAGEAPARQEISQEERENLTDLSALLFADEAENAREAALLSETEHSKAAKEQAEDEERAGEGNAMADLSALLFAGEVIKNPAEGEPAANAIKETSAEDKQENFDRGDRRSRQKNSERRDRRDGSDRGERRTRAESGNEGHERRHPAENGQGNAERKNRREGQDGTFQRSRGGYRRNYDNRRPQNAVPGGEHSEGRTQPARQMDHPRTGAEGAPAARGEGQERPAGKNRYTPSQRRGSSPRENAGNAHE